MGPTLLSLQILRWDPRFILANKIVGPTLPALEILQPGANLESFYMRTYCMVKLMQQARNGYFHGCPCNYWVFTTGVSARVVFPCGYHATSVFWACCKGMSMQQALFIPLQQTRILVVWKYNHIFSPVSTKILRKYDDLNSMSFWWCTYLVPVWTAVLFSSM